VKLRNVFFVSAHDTLIEPASPYRHMEQMATSCRNLSCKAKKRKNRVRIKIDAPFIMILFPFSFPLSNPYQEENKTMATRTLKFFHLLPSKNCKKNFLGVV
jgi:hypothetical protein